MDQASARPPASGSPLAGFGWRRRDAGMPACSCSTDCEARTVRHGDCLCCGRCALEKDRVGSCATTVFGIPDPQWGELVAACVVLKPGMNVTAEALIGHCRERLGNYKVPRHLEFSQTDLPKNGSGKVLKRLLRERFWVGTKRAVG